MKALTIQQPWAWAILHGGKTVENRTQAWRYRGPLLIHAGARLSQRGMLAAHVNAAWEGIDPGPVLVRSAIIGVADLVGAHVAVNRWPTCCEPWGEGAYEHDGRRREVVHLELANARALPEPIPCAGRLGLWTPSDEVLAQAATVI